MTDKAFMYALGAAFTCACFTTPLLAGPTIDPVVIYEIQGTGEESPLVGQLVVTEGNIVTAVTATGYFIQTPDARVDEDEATSNGIFVFAQPSVAVGDAVDVTGTAAEFFELTEIASVSSVNIASSGNPLPSEIVLDETDPPTTFQTVAALEKYEGMRVKIEGGSIGSGTNEFGVVDIVAGPTRPFREMGIPAPGLPGLPVWDGNPELFELDINGVSLPQEEFFAGTTFDAAGVLSFSFGAYRLLPVTFSVVDQPVLPRPVRARIGAEFTVGTLNMLRLSADEADFDIRLEKFSRYIREILGAPDILGVEEVFSLSDLESMASRLNVDENGLNYTAYLIEENVGGVIKVGFLVRDTVSVNEVLQLGAFETIGDGGPLVHNRPPMLLKGNYDAPDGPFPINVIVVHNRSLNGADTLFVQEKRLAQSQSIARMVQDIQTADPHVHLIITGDFNAFEFTDGYVDVVGQIVGNPVPSDNALSGPDLVEPNLTNLTLTLPEEERYSFVFQGSAQVLDHILVSESLEPFAQDIAFGRGNVDAPISYESDPSTALRSSDHEGLVAFFSPAVLSLENAVIAENRPIGESIGVLTSSNLGGGETFIFSTGEGDGDNGRFALSGSTLTTASEIDAEEGAIMHVRIMAAGSNGGSVERTFAIAILDDRTEDSDQDGLSEEDEEDTHGTSDLTADSDGDGVSDGDEVNGWMTSPTDPGELVRVSDPIVDGATLTVAWASVPGVIYKLQSSSGLTADAWSDVPGAMVTADSESTSLQVDLPSADEFYFRIITVEP